MHSGDAQEASKKSNKRTIITEKVRMERTVPLSLSTEKENYADFFYNLYISKVGYPSLNLSHWKPQPLENVLSLNLNAPSIFKSVCKTLSILCTSST